MALSELVERLLANVDSETRRLLLEEGVDKAAFKRALESAAASGGPTAGLRESLAMLDAGENQRQVIANLFDILWQRGLRNGIVLLGSRSSVIWAGRGLGLHEGQAVGTKRFDLALPAGSVISSAAAGAMYVGPYPGGGDSVFYETIGFPPPSALAAIPMIVRGRVQAVVIADSQIMASIAEPDALAVLVHFAGMVVDLLPVRDKFGRLQMPAPAAELPQTQGLETSEPAEPFEIDFAHPEPAAPEPQEPEAGVEQAADLELDLSSVGGELPKIEFAIEHAELPVEQPAAPGGPKAPGGALDLAEYDLDKYGPQEREQHEKAIRFARLLVSEIKLYNEELVRAGREAGDLSIRLRDDIARSRMMYEQRIPEQVRGQEDHFKAELIRQLAGGKPELLGEGS